jgi:ABC-2 type transport system ATP-binding protein
VIAIPASGVRVHTVLMSAASVGSGGDTDTPVIEVHGLRKSYDGRVVVRGIDLQVRHGEVFAFLGPNGAGKTTTVEILEGYRSRDAGEVSVLGLDPAAADHGWRSRVGLVLQSCTMPAELTVRELVEAYAGYYPHPRGVPETIELVGLTGQGDARTTQLSGGQLRRLDVALALIGDPELVFLDEPTTGFDPSARHHAWEVIANLRRLGKTIFLTTHYMDEAQALADRVAVIVAGEIVAEGTPETLGGRDRAMSDVSFSLPSTLGMSQLPDELIPVAQLRDGRVHIAAGEPARVLYALAGWALANGDGLCDLTVGRPTLEDIYLKLTEGAEPSHGGEESRP